MTNRDTRRELIRKIEEVRHSTVITYVTSDRPNLYSGISADAVSVLHEHILANSATDNSKLDLFLYSRGGDSDVPWSIVSMFREYAREGSFSVLVPYRAHSAATVISLGADEIVMTKKAELGPIDITISRGPYNPREPLTQEPLPVSVEDVMGYFALLEKIGCQRPEEVLRGFEKLTGEVHPLVLGTVSRLLEQTKLVALRLLGTRTDPFTEEKNRQIVQRLSAEIFSHRHTISRSEAINYLELEQIVRAEEVPEEGIADELWNLYTEYREFFDLETPFSPNEHLISNELDQHSWSNLPVACIESQARFDLLTQDLQVRRIRQVPPEISINVNLNNLNLPPVNLPNLPANVQPQQLAQLVQQIVQELLPGVMHAAVNEAVREATQAVIQQLPTAGFEHTVLNRGWVKESTDDD